jgi:hypothetical protein
MWNQVSSQFILNRTMKSLLSKIRIYLSYKYKLDQFQKRFIKHNNITWSKNTGSEREILVEVFSLPTSIISYTYLTGILAERYKAKIVGYHPRKEYPVIDIIPNADTKVFYSFCSDIIFLKFPQDIKDAIEKLYNLTYEKIKTKSDLFNLTIDGVWIGESVYDSYLRNYNLPTVDLTGSEFKEELKRSLGYYVYWINYFDKHKIEAVLVSHTIYSRFAIIGRIAMQRKIPVYQINAHGCYSLNVDNPIAYLEFKNYPEEFKKLTEKEQIECKNLARERLERRMSGEIGVDMSYSTKSAFARIENKRVLRESDKIKILIAAHCFFDSPNGLGGNLFPDFYEWLTFLGEMSLKTDYDWYIKNHPDVLPGNYQIIDEFIKRYPKFTLLNRETSHLQIIDDGIDFVFTVYGTVGQEYPYKNIPVVNASLNNPRIAYSFNIHPKSIEDYRNIIENLGKIKYEINQDEILEFYCMRYLHRSDDWLLGNLTNFEKEFGGYKTHLISDSYGKFLDNLDDRKHRQIIDTLNNFINSGEYCLLRRHFSEKIN